MNRKVLAAWLRVLAKDWNDPIAEFIQTQVCEEYEREGRNADLKVLYKLNRKHYEDFVRTLEYPPVPNQNLKRLLSS